MHPVPHPTDLQYHYDFGITDYDMTVTVELLYMPFGVKDNDTFTWQKVTKQVSIEKGGV